ncbi:MAG: hypothetical protein D6773_06735, partial [Alphaproteobacteria bacterium]
MLELTVIVATLTFRPTSPLAQPREVISSGNDILARVNQADLAVLRQNGFPELGLVLPGSPPFATRFARPAEIAASITPCVDSLESAFDFRRRKFGFSGIWVVGPNGDVVFSPDDQSCLDAAGCDDEGPTNDDEDLVLEADESCRLYSIDAPGFDSEPGCEVFRALAQAAGGQFEALNMEFRFLEHLDADGWRVSADLEWHAAVEIGCDENGGWIATSNFAGNRLGVGPPPAPIQQARSEALRRVRSGEILQDHGAIADRASLRRALAALREGDFFAINRLLSESPRLSRSISLRTPLIHELEQIAVDARALQPDTGAWTPRAIAIRVLGLAGAVESVPALLEVIDYLEDTSILGQGAASPAAGALARIGVPAIAPILERCGSETGERWRLMAGVLRQIDAKSPLVRQTMRTVLDAQAWFEEVEAAGGAPAPGDAERARRALVKKRLAEFLSTPEPDRPAPIISALPGTGSPAP